MTTIWQTPNTFELTSQHVFVWQIYIPDFISHVSTDFNLLNEKEKARAKAFKFDRDRESFIVSHAALRKILGRYLKLPPENIQFEFNEHNKPRLLTPYNADVHFNLSHSHDYALVAITLNHDVGVDVEYMRETRDLENIAKRFFSQAEFDEYQQLPAQQKLEGFYNAWTRKEAFIKAIGKGLHYPLKDFVVSLNPVNESILKNAKGYSAENWNLVGFLAADNYCAAIAVPCKNKTFEFYNYDATHF